MATIKSFTDIEQSKKLAKILPPESADMKILSFGIDIKRRVVPIDDIAVLNREDEISCWSLAALLNVMKEPEIIRNSEGKWLIRVWYNKFPYSKGGYDNSVDACVDMIERLHELNLL
jgi:hypothetical protein